MAYQQRSSFDSPFPSGLEASRPEIALGPERLGDVQPLELTSEQLAAVAGGWGNIDPI